MERSVLSVKDFIVKRFDARFIVDDSGDCEYAEWLDATFPDFTCIHHAERRGLGGCFQTALDVVAQSNAEYGFFMEDDTPLLAHIDLDAMASVLDGNQHLAQIMLMRPPFNAEEIQAGGVYQLTPDEFREHTDGTNVWTEHSRWYGFQPNLTPIRAVQCMRANASNFLELGVTDALKPAGYRFSYWGGIDDDPLCDHTGVTRSTGYRW